MGKGELENILNEKRAAAVQLRFDISSKQLKNNKEYRKTRKDIAKIMTILHEMANKK